MTDAIEAGARAFKACRPVERVACQDFGMQQDDILRQQLEAAFEAAIASGALVPASAVAEMRERCAQAVRCERLDDPQCKDDKAYNEALDHAEEAIRQLNIAPASGDYVVGWRDISTAPHETYVLLGWWDEGKWNCETGLASHGWRRNGVSNMSLHGQATHWRHLPDGPPLHAASSNGGEK